MDGSFFDPMCLLKIYGKMDNHIRIQLCSMQCGVYEPF